MSTCPHCGRENADDTSFCERCDHPLDVGDAIPAPQLLAHIQGLIPPEPIISGRRMVQDGELLAAPEVEPEPTGGEEERGGASAPTWREVVPPGRGRHPPLLTPASEPEPRPSVAAARPAPPEPKSPPPPVQAKPAPSSRAIILVPRPVVSPPARGNAWGLTALALIFAFITLLGLLLPTRATPAPRRPAVETAYTYIEVLPRHARVLLAWDYDPATQGELQLLAQPIVRHLRLKRARIVNVSLRPFGPAVAADALAFTHAMLPQEAQLAQPRVVDLGFVPGDAAALRAIAQSPVQASNLPAPRAQSLGLEPERSLDAFDLIIEFSAETTASREWVEQISVRQETPLIIAASGAVAPALRPYEQTGQVAALLSGYPDARAYENLAGQMTGPATRQQNAQSLLQLTFIVVVLVASFLAFRRDCNDASF